MSELKSIVTVGGENASQTQQSALSAADFGRSAALYFDVELRQELFQLLQSATDAQRLMLLAQLIAAKSHNLFLTGVAGVLERYLGGFKNNAVA